MPERDPTFRITFIGFAGLAVAVGIGRFAFTPLLPMMLADGVIAIPGGDLLATLHFVGYLMGALTAARVPLSPRPRSSSSRPSLYCHEAIPSPERHEGPPRFASQSNRRLHLTLASICAP